MPFKNRAADVRCGRGQVQHLHSLRADPAPLAMAPLKTQSELVGTV